MNRLRQSIIRLRELFNKHHRAAQLDAELQTHLALLIDQNLARGLSPEAARRAAQIQLGGPDQIKESVHDHRALPFLETLWQDVHFAARMLRKSPGFTAVAILTLALGIGATTAVFSLVNAVLLKPLPYPHAERIVFPWRQIPPGINLGYDTVPWGRVAFLKMSQQTKTFAALGAFQSDSLNLTGAGQPLRLDALRASAGFFPSLGVSPILGRTFTDEEDHPGREREVILSYGLWRTRFAANPNILGQSIDLNGAPYTVIGVMPRDFSFPRANEMPDGFTFAPEVQIWVPLALDRGPIIPAESDELAVIGRLNPGVSIPQAQADMNVVSKNIESLYPAGGKGWFNSRITLLSAQIAGDTARPLLLLLAAMAVVLLIVSSNLASLLLSRALDRRRELTVRLALGAGKSRLVRQFLTESIVLAVAGGAFGIAFAEAAVYALKLLGPTTIPRLSEVGLDFRVLLFALGATALTGILFGLAPALGATRINLYTSLKDGSRRAGSSPAARHARNSVLVSQIALALVLVVAAGLVTRSFLRLLSVDPGFRAAHVLTFQVALPPAQYPDQPRIAALYHQALQRLSALPGVQSAGLTETVPLTGATESTGIRIPDLPRTFHGARMANYTIVSPGYFAAVGTPILRGRPFLESDVASSQPVTIISEAMAKKYWPGRDPLGKQVGPGSPMYPLATIVGVAADVKRVSLRETPPPQMYVMYNQKVWPSLLTMSFVVRTAQDPSSIIAGVRDVFRSLDPELPISNLSSLDTILSASMTAPRFSMLLLAAFGVLALILAAVGMYGVISYSVAQRTQEIGIRIALGAQRRDVLRMVLRQGARITALGILLGLVASFGAARLVASFLFGVTATDPATFIVVTLVLVIVALFASYVPARRAMNVDPIVALRYE